MTEERTSLRHCIDPRQFDRALLDSLCELTTTIRRLAKLHAGARWLQLLLSDRRAMLYFTQPSTRTFLSFASACHVLGIRFSEIRDPNTSSEIKGESFDDSLRTFSSYVDVIIMRTWEEGRAAQAAALMDRIERSLPIVNAGSGKDQHPTQALLDIYTLERSFERRGGIDGKHIGLVGDLLRGRTARSLATLMHNYEGVRVSFVAPAEYQVGDDVQAQLEASGVEFSLTDDFDAVIGQLDAVYMTRLQSEHDARLPVGESSALYDHSRFALDIDRARSLRPDAVIMHPLPRGPELSADLDTDPRAVYWRQERNGMWMRAALLAHLFGVADQIRDYAVTGGSPPANPRR